MLEPKEVEGERCEAQGVVCFESIYVSAAHTTLQLKLDEVAVQFDSVEEESLLPQPEEEGESEEENEW